MKRTLALLACCVCLAACGYLAEHTAPQKKPAAARSSAAVKADEQFWAVFHGADYAQIDAALNAQTGAYLAAPGDAVTAAHVAWLHMWRISERGRMASVPATITDDLTLARQYFEQAVTLDPKDARYLGFLASATLAEGSIHQDERETRRGYFMLLDSIKAWPEFNLFTAGYVMSDQLAGSKRFTKALEWQWETLDRCAGEKVNRSDPVYAKYMPLETRDGAKRVCWNSAIAPHNFEGFFMNMGDMLVKSGDWRRARVVYANAKLSATYAQWNFGNTLEDRIRDAADNVAAFAAPAAGAAPDGKRIMIATTFSCMACHQQSVSDGRG